MNDNTWSIGELEAPPDPGSGARPSSTPAGERYVDTSTWPRNALHGHGSVGENLLLRWNAAPAASAMLDVVVHLHGYIGRPASMPMLREVVARSGLDLGRRARPTLGLIPRGRPTTAAEVRAAKALGKKLSAMRYTFPALMRDRGAGLEALIHDALAWFAREVLGRFAAAPLSIGRLILTAHSGGGEALNSLLAQHARRRVCNPDEVQVFDGFYGNVSGVQSWVEARLSRDREKGAAGGGLRVFYIPPTPRSRGTGPQSMKVAQLLPRPGDPLRPWYRVEATKVSHNSIPNTFGSILLNDRAADFPERVAPSHQRELADALRTTSSMLGSEMGAWDATTWPSPSFEAEADPLAREVADDPVSAANTRAWILDTSRSALERLPQSSARQRYMHRVDWSKIQFPGNDKETPGVEANWRLADELFSAVARLVPERRVPFDRRRPESIRYNDVGGLVEDVPGQRGHKLFPEARDAFVRMHAAAAFDGVQLSILSSWRSARDQARLRAKQPNRKAVARHSPHMYGLAVDLETNVDGLRVTETNTRTRERMANLVRMYRSPVYKWMALRGREFGWYPYRREPWHWEYNPPAFKERFESAVIAGRITSARRGATDSGTPSPGLPGAAPSPGAGMLSASFRLREFASRGTPVPPQYLGNVRRLAQNLQVLRDLLGRPIRITSGYRTAAHNAAVRGATQSEHLLAKAADIQVDGLSPIQVYCAIERHIAAGRMQQGGLGIYQRFVHYDVRDPRARWQGRGAARPDCQRVPAP